MDIENVNKTCDNTTYMCVLQWDTKVPLEGSASNSVLLHSSYSNVVGICIQKDMSYMHQGHRYKHAYSTTGNFLLWICFMDAFHIHKGHQLQKDLYRLHVTLKTFMWHIGFVKHVPLICSSNLNMIGQLTYIWGTWHHCQCFMWCCNTHTIYIEPPLFFSFPWK